MAYGIDYYNLLKSFFSFQQHITSPSLLSITNIKFEFSFNSFPIFHLLSLSFSFSLIFTFFFLSLISPALHHSQTITSSFHSFLFYKHRSRFYLQDEYLGQNPRRAISIITLVASKGFTTTFSFFLLGTK